MANVNYNPGFSLSPPLSYTPTVGAAVPTVGPSNATLGASVPVVNLLNQVTGGLTGISSLFPNPTQYFYSIPFPNNQPCLYQLVLTSAGSTVVKGVLTSILPLATYTFPLTPSSIQYQTINMTAYYDVQGGYQSYGIQRIVDQYGITPPIITIAGTTGFQFHSLDGFQWSGRISMYRLQQMILTYHNQYQQAIQSNNASNVPHMFFTDGFTGNQFEVIPFGPVGIHMDNSKPIIQFYDLNFLTLRYPDIPENENIDPVSLALIQTEGELELTIRTVLSGVEGALTSLILGPAGLTPSPAISVP